MKKATAYVANSRVFKHCWKTRMMVHGIQVSPLIPIKHVAWFALSGRSTDSVLRIDPLSTMLSVRMSPSFSAISSSLMKKAIPFYPPNSILPEPPNPRSLLLSSVIPLGKIVNDLVHDKPKLISIVAQLLLVKDQSNYPPEFPRRPDYSPPSVPPEVPQLPNAPEIETTPPEVETQPPNIPEVPTPGTDYPFPPPPTPTTPPDIPLPPPGTPCPTPPDQLPPRLPPDPDILPPPTHPPPDIIPPPEIKPPPGPFVSFIF